MARLEKPPQVLRGNPPAIIDFLLDWYYMELGRVESNLEAMIKDTKGIFDIKQAQALEFIVSRIDWLEEQRLRFDKRLKNKEQKDERDN